MRTLSSKIVGLPVVTESGTKVGKLVDLELDLDGYQVINILVQSRLFGKEDRIISVSQIVRIEAKQVMVRDGTVPETTVAKGTGGLNPIPATNLN